MKKMFRNNKLIAIAFLTVFTSLATAPAIANNGREIPVEFKYVGNFNNQAIFELNVNGSSFQNDYILSIKDQAGISYYWENIKSENFTKKFLFDSEELGDDTLQMSVYCRKTNKTYAYTIKRQNVNVSEITLLELK